MNLKKLGYIFILSSFFLSGNQVWSMQKLSRQVEEKIKAYKWTDQEIRDIWTILKNDPSPFSGMDYEKFKQKFMDLGEVERRNLQKTYNWNNFNIYLGFRISDPINKSYVPFGEFIKASPKQKSDMIKKSFEEYFSKISNKSLKELLVSFTNRRDEEFKKVYFISKQEMLDLIKNEMTSLKRLKPQKGGTKRTEKSED